MAASRGRGREAASSTAGAAEGMITIKYLSELPSFKVNVNQVSSISLPMTSSMALANEGLCELTLRPSCIIVFRGNYQGTKNNFIGEQSSGKIWYHNNSLLWFTSVSIKTVKVMKNHS